MELLDVLGEQQVAGFICVLARISPLFLVAPLFSSRQLPARARSVAAVALAVGLLPVANDGMGRLPMDIFGLGEVIGKELIVGLGYAFFLSALFAAISAAGALLDTMIGFSFGALVDPMTGSQSTVVAQLYSMTAVLVFIAVGGDGMLIQGLARTYELVPLTDAPSIASLTAGVQQAFVGLFVSSIEVCAPVLLALVITDIAMGMVAKVVPQLNVFAVGFPAKVAVGFLLIGASLPFATGWLTDELQRSVSDALQVF